MTINVEAEIRDLKRRVSELEGSFGFLTQQVKTVHRDLLAFQEKTEQRFDQVDDKLDKMDGRLNHIERDVRGLRTDMPKMVADTMREVLAEKPRKKP
jgi:archaellum component FlaC